MKKILISIFSLIIVSVIVCGSFAPVVAITINSDITISQDITTFDVTNIPISERYHIIENGYLGKYNLQEGVFGYQSSKEMMFSIDKTKRENKTSVYFYSDGYFAESPEIYNTSLSTMSFTLALSAFNAIRTDYDSNLISGQYSNLFRNVKLLLSDIGIKENDIYINDGYANRPTEKTIGMIMGAKEISLENEDYILIPIAVRGGDYETEWASNFDLGESGESYGFSSASTQVVEQIEKYINSNTNFDISAALNEGKVKFWIVGYSRGGAVANITAKRLTDKYGEYGNSIYAYCFEAPSGGVDSEEIKQPWTHNGIYANIHNIINTADLVPHVPPKQMGFKRYGIDHYMPGTEAGEIVTSTYTTPSGITVTTHADNVAYIVGSDVYNERRTEMLWHFNNIDSTLEFTDSFSLVTIDILESILSGDIFSGNIFKEIETEEPVTSAQWIECLVNDLQAWIANGTYSNGKLQNGGYDNDYRKFYTTNSEFSGEEYVTPEVALRCILRLVFSYYDDKEFLDTIMYRGLSLLKEYSTILDFYSNVINKWDKLSETNQTKYLDKIWDCLECDMKYDDGAPVKKITDYVNEDERELLKKSVYSASAFLFLFVCKDNKTSPDINGVNKTLVYTSTLIKNAQTIAQGHYPEVCLAWLSTYDENYSPENENSKFIHNEIKLINDSNNASHEIKAKIDIEETKTIVSLTSIINSTMGVDANSENNGTSIYYAIFENGIMVNNWQLYRAPIVLNTTLSTQYSIKVFGTRFEEIGAELEIDSEMLQTSTEEHPDNNINNDSGDSSNNNFEDDMDEDPINTGNEITANDETPSPNVTSVVLISSATILIIISIVFISKKRKHNKK